VSGKYARKETADEQHPQKNNQFLIPTATPQTTGGQIWSAIVRISGG